MDTFSERSGAVLGSLLAGASAADAARQHGVSSRTVERWVQKGRLDSAGRYGAFAAAVDARRALEPEEDFEPVTADELALLVSKAARAGSVPAMRLRHQMLAEAADGRPYAADAAMREVDELARRRALNPSGGAA